MARRPARIQGATRRFGEGNLGFGVMEAVGSLLFGALDRIRPLKVMMEYRLPSVTVVTELTAFPNYDTK